MFSLLIRYVPIVTECNDKLIVGWAEIPASSSAVFPPIEGDGGSY